MKTYDQDLLEIYRQVRLMVDPTIENSAFFLSSDHARLLMGESLVTLTLHRGVEFRRNVRHAQAPKRTVEIPNFGKYEFAIPTSRRTMYRDSDVAQKVVSNLRRIEKSVNIYRERRERIFDQNDLATMRTFSRQLHTECEDILDRLAIDYSDRDTL